MSLVPNSELMHLARHHDTEEGEAFLDAVNHAVNKESEQDTDEIRALASEFVYELANNGEIYLTDIDELLTFVEDVGESVLSADETDEVSSDDD